MLYGTFSSLLRIGAGDPLVAIDIGTSAIKVVSIDNTGKKPSLLSAGSALTPANCINNNAISDPAKIGAVVRSILEANEVEATRAVFGVPGPAVFTKKITVAYSDLKELEENILFEASNYIPHNIDAVHLDYQVIGSKGKSTMEVLLVAVKNDIISSYQAAIIEAELEPLIADVDYFALENMLEVSYPEERGRAVALVNLGARYTSVSILENGKPLFTGDVGVGGRLYTEALCDALGMEPASAEQAKMGLEVDGYDLNLINETIDRTTEHAAAEIHRQLGFFWNSAATEKSIEAVYVCGGAAQSLGLCEELAARTGIDCTLVDPFRGIDWSDSFDRDYIDEIKLSMGVGVGLALRGLGDKQHQLG